MIVPIPSLASEASDVRIEVIGVAALAPTPGGTVTIDLTTGAKVAAWTAAETETVNCSGDQKVGQEITLLITNDAGAARTITFGTGFKPASTLVGTENKTAAVSFVSNGTSFYETGRITEIT